MQLDISSYFHRRLHITAPICCNGRRSSTIAYDLVAVSFTFRSTWHVNNRQNVGKNEQQQRRRVRMQRGVHHGQMSLFVWTQRPGSSKMCKPLIKHFFLSKARCQKRGASWIHSSFILSPAQNFARKSALLYNTWRSCIHHNSHVAVTVAALSPTLSCFNLVPFHFTSSPCSFPNSTSCECCETQCGGSIIVIHFPLFCKLKLWYRH